jgi:hypothetical protein
MEISKCILYNKLDEISRKYETENFTNIDFIKLFKLHKAKSHEINYLKNYIKRIYLKLILNYHSDKYPQYATQSVAANSSEYVYNPDIDYSVRMDHILSGKMVSYISDINEMLNEVLIKEPEILISLIKGDIDKVLFESSYIKDFSNLKNAYGSSVDKEYKKASEEQLREFESKNSKVIDTSLSLEELEQLINTSNEEREKVKVENLFNEEDMKDPNFMDKFNLTFNNMTSKSDKQETFELMPCNYNQYSLNSYENFFGDNGFNQLEEVFQIPNRGNSDRQIKQMTYEEILRERAEFDKTAEVKTINKMD